MTTQRIGIGLLLVTVFSLAVAWAVGASDYSIDLRCAGYCCLGPGFEYERGLYYEYAIRFPASDRSRAFWLLIDLDGNREWRKEDIRPGATGWTVEARTRSSEGMDEGTHVLTISVYEDPNASVFMPSLSSPPGYPAGEVRVPDDWTLRATDRYEFRVLSAGFPSHGMQGMWVSSTPLGAEIYVAPASAARGPDGRYAAGQVVDDRYYRGGAPAWIDLTPGDYVVVALLAAEEELDLQFDDARSRFVVTSRGDVAAIGLLYEATCKSGEASTLIASFQLEDVPLDAAFLWLPDAPLYSFNGDVLLGHLLQEGIAPSTAQSMVSVLKMTGKATVETGSRRVVVELTPGGWRIRVFQ